MKKETSQYLSVIRIVGMAIAWTVMLIPTSFQYFSVDYDSSRFDSATILFCLGGTLASFAVVNLLRRGSDVPFSLLMVGGALFAVGNSVTYASTVAYLLPGYLTYPFVTLQGAGTALFILSWIQLSSSLFPATFAKDIAMSMAGGTLLLAIIAILRNSPSHAWIWPFIAVAITIVSLSCSFVVIKRKGSKPSELFIQGKVTNPYFVPLSVELSLSVIGFAALFSHAGVANLQSSLNAAEGLIVAIIVLISFLVFAQTQFSKREPTWMVKLSLLMLVVGIMANFVVPHMFALVSRSLIFSGSICAFFSLLIMLKVISDRQSVNRSYAFALGFSFFYLGGTLAETCLVILTSAQGEAGSELPLVRGILLSLIVVALFVDAAFFLDGKPSNTRNIAQSDATWSPEQACIEITAEYNLTKRQAEVLLLIIQGKRVRDIEKTLTISNGTARAHVRGVYEKCGVHSRSELMSLVMKTAPR